MIEILSKSDTLSLKKVTSLELIEKRKSTFHPEGLFSKTIFGKPELSCSCGLLKGLFYSGMTCPVCNKEVEINNFDKKGIISLPKNLFFVNPIILKILLDNKINLLNLLNPHQKKINIDGNLPLESIQYSFFNMFNNYEEFIHLICDKNEKLIKFLLEKKEFVLLQDIVVIPIHLRNAFLDAKISQIQLDAINKLYLIVLTHVKTLESMRDYNANLNIEMELFELHNVLIDLYEFVLNIISEKEGIIRDCILSNRIQYSGRAVIVLNESNDPLSCVLPKILFMETYFPALLKFISKNLNNSLTEALNYYMLNRFDKDNIWINEAVEKILATKPIFILIRNPSLHMESVQAFFVESLTDSDVIKIPKTCFGGFNADLDGDTQFAVPVLTEEAKQEAILLMAVNNLFSNESLKFNTNMGPSQDNTLGLFLLDHNNIS